jgi:hypothetical protein
MVASARAAILARAAAPIEDGTIGRLAAWLLMAVALDLVLIRFLVRLAIFVPKGEPFATVAAGLGRVGAAADALVPIVGILLLTALLMRAGRVGGPAERATLASLAVVAVGGLALVVLPPLRVALVALGLLAAGIACVGALWIVTNQRIPIVARLGLGLLATSVACAMLAPGLEGWLAGTPRGEGVGPALAIVGQFAFVIGAALAGLAGLLAARRITPPPSSANQGPLASPAGLFAARRAKQRNRGLIAAGVFVAGAVLVAWLAAPAMWSVLAIWSIGLSAVVPAPLVAVAIGLCAAGLPALHRYAPAAAVGAAIVLLAGYGQAASGLVLASLIGIMVAALPLRPPATETR